METPSQRVKRIEEETRRKIAEHEKFSRSMEGKSMFPLRARLSLALPLVAIAITLYTLTIKSMRSTKRPESVAEISTPTDGNHIASQSGTAAAQNYGLFGQMLNNEGSQNDGELLDDSDKKW